MKQKLLFLLGLAVLPIGAMAQTWVGGVSNDWGTAGNWSPANVPTSAGNVTINAVSGSNVAPKLSNDISVASITMNQGSQLDVNGHNITTTNRFDANGTAANAAIINNTGLGSAGFSLTIGGVTGTSYFRGLEVNSNINVVINGTNIFYEGHTISCQFNGNVSYTHNSSGSFYTSFSSGSSYTGNLSINSINSSNLYLFNTGTTSVGGNFSLTKLQGGNTYLGNSSGNTTIGGTINVNYEGVTPGVFNLERLKNNTAGGDILIDNFLANSIIARDTLKLNTLQMTNYYSISGNFTMASCSVLGNVAFSTTTLGMSTDYYQNNTIDGNLSITKNNTGVIYEGYITANTITGNFDLTINNSGTVNTSFSAPSTIGGNFTLNRTVAGTTNLFNNGGIIGGNFSYTNLFGGASNLGVSTATTNVGGIVNVNYEGVTPGVFNLERLKNNTAGGDILISNFLAHSTFSRDTFKLNTMQLANFSSVSGNFTMASCSVLGNVGISTTALGASTDYYRNNTIDGNLSITKNNTGVIYEGYITANTITGNFDLTINNSGTVNTSFSAPSIIGGNFTVNRTVAGTTNLFNNGGIIGGNFSYTNLWGGNSAIGSSSTQTSINGSININYNDASANAYSFEINRVKNNTDGGNVAIAGLGATRSFLRDTLMISSFELIDFYGNASTTFHENQFTGNCTISDLNNTGVIYLNNNTFNNVSITRNGTGTIYESHTNANNYLGNAIFTNNNASGTFNINFSRPALFHKNLTLNGSQPYNISTLKFVGNTNGTFIDNRATIADFTGFTIDKSAGNNITLASPVFMNGNVTFVSGDIITTSTSKLTFRDNRTYVGASDNSKVIGPVTKIGNDAFTFPIGKVGKYIPLSISAPAMLPDAFTAQVIDGDATLNGYDTASRASGLAVINGMEYFNLSPEAGTASSVFVNLGYNFGTGGVNDQSVLRVAHWKNGIWENLGNGAVDGNLLLGSVRSANAVSDFSPFAVAASSVSGAPLPVQLLDFDAVLNNEKVNVSWKVAKEDNLNRYEVGRSADGIQFETLVTVEARALANYQQLDVDPMQGKSYYRLRMVDNDGNSQLSKVTLVINDANANLSLSPNPANDKIQLHHADLFADYSIFDLQGKKVLEGTLPQAKQIDIASLSSGVYIIHLNGAAKNQDLKFVKQ